MLENVGNTTELKEELYKNAREASDNTAAALEKEKSLLNESLSVNGNNISITSIVDGSY